MTNFTQRFIGKYVPKKYREAIKEVHKDIDGYWVYLEEGFISTTTEVDCIHEYSIADVKRQFKTIERTDSK